MKEKHILFLTEINKISANNLMTIINDAIGNQASKVHLYMNTHGGDISATEQICNFLDGIKGKIGLITYNLGNVLSAGVTVYCMGDERVCVTNGAFFFHPVSRPVSTDSYNWSNARDLWVGLEILEQFQADFMSKNTGTSSAKFMTLMRDVSRIQAEEAKKLNIVTKIVPKIDVPLEREIVRELQDTIFVPGLEELVEKIAQR